MESLPGRVGRYEILSLVGRGAMGVVYRARDPLIGREVALKRVSLSDLLPEDQRVEFKERFFREARAAGNLRHPNIVTVYDVGESEGVPYMAMEYLSGGSLSALMKAGPVGLERAASIARQVALGLHYAHSRGIVHRDIKPDNILLDGEGRAVVTDFGAAHLQSSELTRTGEVLGTPHYMSPEQILGEELDGRSDLFSLGVVLYLMVTGRRPFKGDTISAICYHIVHSPPEPVPEGMRLPPAAAPVLDRMLSKRREERYRDGEEVARALETLEGEPSSPASGASMTQTVNVSTPTPRPGTLPAPPPPQPARPIPSPRPAAPHPHASAPPSVEGGIHWGLWIGLGVLFAVLLILAVLGGAFIARRIEMRRIRNADQGVSAPASPSVSTQIPPATQELAPATEAGSLVPPAPHPPAPPRPAQPASPPPRTSGAPARPHPIPPPAAVSAIPAGPDAAVVAACETLGRDADRAVALAKGRDFAGACELADRLPQRIQEIVRLASPLEQAPLAAARAKAEQAGPAIQEELAAWARPILAQAQQVYSKATDGLDDEDEIIRAYVLMAPALRWRERLPKVLRAEMDAFAQKVKEDLDEDEWAKAQAQAGMSR